MTKPKKTKACQTAIKARQTAADSLHGIWANLPKKAIKELMKKSY